MIGAAMLAAGLAVLVTAEPPARSAWAQNFTCPTAPAGDSSNRCASTQFVGQAVRQKLLGPANFFVRPNGSDTNCSGLTNANDPGSGALPRACAFKTVQKSIANLCSGYDLAANTVLITALTGQTYTEQLQVCPFVGFAPFLGYSQVTINLTGSTLSAIGGIGVFASNNLTPWTIKGGTYTNCSITCIEGDSGGLLGLDGPTFGAITGNHVTSLYSSRIVFINNNYTVAGGAGVHWYAQFQGAIFIQPGKTVLVSGAPAFFSWAYSQWLGFINAIGTTYSGAATGTKFLADRNAVIDTGNQGSEFFPGTANSCNPIPTCATNGGQYN
jgi:hypothetical protein